MPDNPDPQPTPVPPKPTVPVKRSPFRFVAPLLILIAVGLGLYLVLTRVLKLNLPFLSAPPSSGPVELTYWGLWEPEGLMQAVFTSFQSSHPGVTVTYQQQKSADYRERLQTALESGQGPVIFRYHATWVPMLKNVLDTVPDSIFSSSDLQTQYYPVISQSLITPKGPVGIPLMIDGLGLYYNKSLLTAAGQPVPTSWDELRRVAKALTVTREGSIERAGVALGTTGNIEHWSDVLAIMMLQNAANPATPNNKLGQDALEFYTIFSRMDKVWDDTMPAAVYAFATEKVAMMLAPSWRAHDVIELNPSLEFAIAPIPQLPDTNITWGSFWVEGVSSKASSAQKQAAWELLSSLSQKDTLRAWYAAISDVRRFGEPFPRIDMADQLNTDPLVGAYILQAPQAQSWYMASFTHDNGVNDQIIKYYEDAVNAVNQGETPEKALATVEQGIAQVLSRYNIR